MLTYTGTLVLLMLLCVIAAAMMALKYIRISVILRMLCKDLITKDLRHHEKIPTEDAVEDELLQMIEKKEEET